MFLDSTVSKTWHVICDILSKRLLLLRIAYFIFVVFLALKME